MFIHLFAFRAFIKACKIVNVTRIAQDFLK